MQILLTFDSTQFTQHITNTDDRNMVDYIVKEYGPALAEAISFHSDDTLMRIQMYYQDAYFRAIMASGNHFEDDCNKAFRRRTVDDDGNVQSTKARYDELVDTIVHCFNNQCIAVLRGIQYQARQIYTVDVLGYENRALKIVLKTDGAIQP